MTTQLSIGQLSILHSLRDGDDPILRTPVSELIFFERDVSQLIALDLVRRSGRLLALTLEGMEALTRPGNSQPPYFDPCTQPEWLHRMVGAA